MSGSRKRPSPSPTPRGKKKFNMPKWLIGSQSQPEPSSGVADVTPKDVIVENGSVSSDSNSPTSQEVTPNPRATAPTNRSTARTTHETAPNARAAAPTNRSTARTTHETAPNTWAAAPTIRSADPTTNEPDPNAQVVAPTNLAVAPTNRASALTSPTTAPSGPNQAPTTSPTTWETTPIIRAAAPRTSDPQSSSSPASFSAATGSSGQRRLTIWVEDKQICPSSVATKLLRECFELDLEPKGYKIKCLKENTRILFSRISETMPMGGSYGFIGEVGLP